MEAAKKNSNCNSISNPKHLLHGQMLWPLSHAGIDDDVITLKGKYNYMSPCGASIGPSLARITKRPTYVEEEKREEQSSKQDTQYMKIQQVREILTVYVLISEMTEEDNFEQT